MIGAVAIAVLLVVFVPMILDSEPRTADHPEPSLTIPPKDKAEPLPSPAKVPVEAARAAAAAPATPDPTPAPSAPAEASKAPQTPPKAAPAVTPAPAPKATVPPAPAPAQPATPKLEGFAVQVGAFKDEAKLKQARDKLVAAKIPHYIERRQSSVGELTRLRAGPFATRDAAEKALATMKAASISGQVVPLP